MEFTLDQALKKGVEAHRAGRAHEADRYYTAILKANPKHPDANHNMGVLAVGLGKVDAALPFFKTALEANSSIAQFWLSYINALIKLDRVADAKAVFEQAKNNGAKGDGFDKIELQLNNSPVEVIIQTQKDITAGSNILDELKLDKALTLANKKVTDGLSDEAKKIYQDILEKFPKNKKALNGIRNLASKTVANTSDMREPSREQLQNLVNLYTQGQCKELLNKGSKLLEQFPYSINLYNIIGAANTSLGKLSDAIEAYKKAVAIKPDYSDAYNNMAIALKEQGKLEEAVEAYNKAVAIKPDYAEAYNNLSITLKEQGKLEEATEACIKAIAIKPDYAEAYSNMGVTLQEQRKLEEAVEAYNKAVAIKPDYAEAYSNMGVTLQEQRKLEEAVEAYNKAVAIKPDYAEAYYNLGLALKEYGKLEEAIEAYSKAVSVKPDYADAYNNMGVALKEKDQLEQAVEAYNKAISIMPDYAGAFNNLGLALIEQGKPEKAVEAYDKALSIKPDYAEAYSNMGVTFQEQDQPEKAIEAYNTAISIMPEYAEAYNNLGNVLTQKNQLEKAIVAYNKALCIRPEYAEAHRNLSTIKNYTAEDRQLLQIQALFKKKDLSDDERCNLSFAMAKIYEDVGELHQAYNYLFEGNKLRKKLLKYSIKEDQELFNKFEKTQPFLQRNSLEIEKDAIEIIPIFILGMPRSGTTLVEQIISSHSNVTGAGELHHVSQFGGHLALNPLAINTRAVSEFRVRYLSEISKVSNGNSIITDKMPQNFRFIPLICSAFPEAKIIHVERDPSAICWSNYRQYFRSRGLSYCYDLNDVVDYYFLYKNLMEIWQSHYGSRVYNLNYENLVTDRENQTRDLIDYLELNWEECCLVPHRNNRSVKTASQQQVRQKVYQGSSKEWRKYVPFLNGAFDRLP